MRGQLRKIVIFKKMSVIYIFRRFAKESINCGAVFSGARILINEALLSLLNAKRRKMNRQT
jgi:hypothetical protein